MDTKANLNAQGYQKTVYLKRAFREVDSSLAAFGVRGLVHPVGGTEFVLGKSRGLYSAGERSAGQ